MQCIKSIYTICRVFPSDRSRIFWDAIVVAINIFIARKTLKRCRIVWCGFRNVIRRQTGIVFARGNNMLPT